MTEAFFGLLGVIIGSILTWIQSWRSEKQSTQKSATYLAVRVVWDLNKFVKDCSYVVKDDGYTEEGQRGRDGTLEAQVKSPCAPVYANDIDWRSIDPNLMYQILSLPSEISKANNCISGTHYFSHAPDYEEFFEERQYQYSCLGLMALELEMQLRRKYKLPVLSEEYTEVYKILNDVRNSIENNREEREQKSLGDA